MRGTEAIYRLLLGVGTVRGTSQRAQTFGDPRHLCGLDDQPMFVDQECMEDVTKIALRFYFWAFHLFFQVDMEEIVNQVWEIELIDPSIKWEWEPLFYMNSSAERIAWMERYQHVWWDMVNSEKFSIQEAVTRYGYADQAHLLNEFKRFHGMTPREAMQIVLENR